MGDMNEDGNRIIDFCVRNNMSIMNTFKQQETHKWTWYSWNHIQGEYTQKSMIDLALSSRKSLIHEVKSIPSLSLDSDHRAVVAKVNITIPPHCRRLKRKRIEVEKLKYQRVREELDDKLAEITITGETIEQQWKIAQSQINNIAEEVVGVKWTGGCKKKRTAYWNEEVQEAVREKNKYYRLWIKRRTEEARQQYVRKRNAAKSIKRKAQKDSWEQLGQDLEQDLQNSKKLLYSIAKSYRKGNGEYNYSIKDSQGNLLTEPEEIDKRWKEYFSNLLNIEEDGERTDEEQTNGVWVDEEEGINESEVKKALAKIKNNKACGVNNIPGEIFKYGGGTALRLLTELLNKAWDTDLEKAFDRVPRDKLWAVLQSAEYQIPPKLRRAIKNLYNSNSTTVKPVSETIQWFDISFGVRQGNDILNIESSSHAASESLSLLNAVLTEYGLKLNLGKSEVMVVSRREETLNMENNGVPIQQKKSVKYLGVTWDGKAKYENAVESRIAAYSQNLGLLYPLMKDRNVPTAVKIVIYKSFLRSILTYGCESWTLTTKTSSKVQAAEMRALRLIKGVNEREHGKPESWDDRGQQIVDTASLNATEDKRARVYSPKCSIHNKNYIRAIPSIPSHPSVPVASSTELPQRSGRQMFNLLYNQPIVLVAGNCVIVSLSLDIFVNLIVCSSSVLVAGCMELPQRSVRQVSTVWSTCVPVTGKCVIVSVPLAILLSGWGPPYTQKDLWSKSSGVRRRGSQTAQ
ncbi:uncharacterized protein LOC143024543 [Oratosquilla oratoria]|uniref:uncharacterized protein LOC143024543 n=1 Tax=Oratosquilla oratoria TaxID=337810 RepID=UPI003F76A97A